MSLRLPRWFAHRGGGTLAPENTLAGIRLAAQLGFRAVEFDVMLSADGQPFLIHDETLERTTSGHGRVAETPAAVLCGLDAGAGERLPSLAEAAALCQSLGLLANVEIKPSSGLDVLTAEVVVTQLRQCWRGMPLLLSSFSLPALAVARDLAPELPRGLLFEALPADWSALVAELQAVSVHCDADLLTEKQLAEVVDRDIPLLCYTVNCPNRARALFAAGVSALFTDRLDLFSPAAVI